MRITRHASAKINLNLYITGRRADGYHLLDSIMAFTAWGDRVAIEPSEALSLTVTGSQSHIITGALLSVDRDSPNLVIKAAYAMADAMGRKPNIDIHLEKNIPSGAGLGGGSSDAAACMHALNELWGHPLSLDDLCAIGLQFGAEMPICILGKSARVQGVGDIITPIDIPPMNIVIAWPDHSLLTADVFQTFKNDGHDFDDVSDMQRDIKSGKNSLTATAVSLCPEVETIIQSLRAADGCQLASMSGAGSACFGVFETSDQAEKAASLFSNAITTKIDEVAGLPLPSL